MVKVTIGNLLLAAILAAVVLASIENQRSLAHLRKAIVTLEAQKALAPVYSRDDELYAWQTVETLENISIVNIGKKKVKASPFSIKFGPDPMQLQIYKVPDGWSADRNVIESTLPYPWNADYVQKYHQPFNADSFMFNMAALANLYRETHDYASIQAYVEFLVGRLKEYSILDGDASLVTYRFTYRWHDREMKSGWVSAYGNASALAGLVYLAGVAQRPDIAELATRYFNGLQRFDGDQTPWVTSVDEDQYLWFEEMPLDGSRKARVLNGHIWTVFSLYYYAEAHRSSDALNLLNAGLTSLKRYLKAYRYPGRVNRYDRYSDYNPDYLPRRTVDMQRLLFAMTGDPFFNEMAEQFMTDMPY